MPHPKFCMGHFGLPLSNLGGNVRGKGTWLKQCMGRCLPKMRGFQVTKHDTSQRDTANS